MEFIISAVIMGKVGDLYLVVMRTLVQKQNARVMTYLLKAQERPLSQATQCLTIHAGVLAFNLLWGGVSCLWLVLVKFNCNIELFTLIGVWTSLWRKL